MSPLLKVLLLASASAPGWAVKVGHIHSTLPKDVLLGTQIFPEDRIPADIPLLHQAKMISHWSAKLQLVIVDNRPPWISNSSVQEEVMDSLKENFEAEILKVDRHSYERAYKDPSFLQKFFSTGDETHSIETIEQAHTRSGQEMLGVLTFLERCVDADPNIVELCAWLDPQTIVYRDLSEERGILELARDAFYMYPHLTVVNPSTMCDWEQPKNNDFQPVRLREAGIVSLRYFIVHRARLVEALPLEVPHEKFNLNFEHLFHIGLRHHSPYASRRMTCGQAFAISPTSQWAHCRPEQNLNIEKHAKLMAGPRGSTRKFFEHSQGYYGFDANMAEGLGELLKRVEAGKLPKPEDPWSISNQCQDICPDKTRIQDGLAW